MAFWSCAVLFSAIAASFSDHARSCSAIAASFSDHARSFSAIAASFSDHARSFSVTAASFSDLAGTSITLPVVGGASALGRPIS